MDIYQVNTLLIQAQEQLKISSEYQKVQELKTLLEQKYNERENLSKDERKQELVKLGFEVRTGHKLFSNDVIERGVMTYHLDDYQFIVVHKSQPPINEVSINYNNWDDCVYIHFGDYKSEDTYTLGISNSEEGAWTSACKTWIESSIEEINELIKE